MADFAVDVGLGGLFRYHTITATDIVSCWPLHEKQLTTARDIANGVNTGTWVNTSGMTRGVSVDLPEGALGATFDGTGYVEVMNDGEGYRLIGDDAGSRNLSCAGGDIDIVFLIRTTTNDGTERAIVQKCETDSSGNGWKAYLLNGAIGFALKVGGVSVFDFTRGDVADGEWHLVHCVYQTGDAQAQILIDGAMSGSDVTGVSTEPDLTTANLRIGMYNDDSGGLLATLSGVAVHRAGNPNLSTDLQATRFWTDVTADVLDACKVTGGMTGTTLKDRQAGIGMYSFALDNGDVLGKWTIGHANAQAGFDIGVPVRLRVTVNGNEEVRFRGRLVAADPETGEYRGRRVRCVAADWFAQAAITTVSHVPIAVDIRSDLAFAMLVDMADYPPPALTLTAGNEVFPFFGDAVNGPLLGEMTKVVVSEGGYAYMLPDGTLKFEGRGIRQVDTTVDATFDGTMRDLTVEIRESALLNQASVTTTPRRLGGTATTVLYAQVKRTSIPPRDRAIFDISYQDPDQSRSRIGGADLQPFTAGTDYTFTAEEGGGGANLVAFAAPEVALGGSGGRIVVYNTSDSDLGWFAFQVRGRALYTDVPQTERIEDSDSVRKYGPALFEETYPYIDDPATARAMALMALRLFAAPTRVPSKLVLMPDPETAFEQTVALLNPGDQIALGEAMSAVDVAQRMWIQSYEFTFSPGGFVEATFGVFPSFASSGMEFAVWDEATWDNALWCF